MAVERADYHPRQSERGVLHRVVRAHVETFLAEAARGAGGARLPGFVEQEFRDFLTCGVLAHGFARVRCDTCAIERLVPFDFHALACLRCGSRIWVLATIEDPGVIRRILTHLGFPREPVPPDLAQPPPAFVTDPVVDTGA